MKKSNKNEENIDKKEEKLITLLKNDEILKENRENRMEMLAMASMFLENFSRNMYKTSIELNELIPYYSIDQWKDFLNYPIVRKYIKSFRDEQINMMADQGLAEGNKDAVGIKKALGVGGPQTNNSNIILVRVPEKEDFYESK